MPEKPTISTRWGELHNERTSLLNRCEQYSEWTLPWLHPPLDLAKNEVLPKSYNSIGARCVNHLANKLMTVLFPADRPFYRGIVGEETTSAAAALGVEESDIKSMLARVERKSMETTNIASHRAKAADVAKNLLVVGNAMPYYYRDDAGKLQCFVYTVRNYVVKRMYDGGVLELITKDCKLFGSFKESAQQIIAAAKGSANCSPNTKVTLYTHVKWDAERKRYVVQQAADDVDLNIPDTTFPRRLLPWLPLTWNRVDGEDYGRGMVEDHQLGFNAHAVLSKSVSEMISIMSDIKRYVKPSSVCDIEHLNTSDPGSTHAAEPGDIWYADLGNKAYDLQAVIARLQQLEQQLASAFLLTSASTRQAERVTAEEIRMQIQELETSLGGMYSKLANEWQLPLATILLEDALGMPELDVTPLIITGMDAMSRSAETESLYGVFQDLATAQQTGEFFMYVNPGKLIDMACTNRGFDRTTVFLSDEEIQQKQAEQAQQAAMLMQKEQEAQLAQAAMKE